MSAGTSLPALVVSCPFALDGRCYAMYLVAVVLGKNLYQMLYGRIPIMVIPGQGKSASAEGGVQTPAPRKDRLDIHLAAWNAS